MISRKTSNLSSKSPTSSRSRSPTGPDWDADDEESHEANMSSPDESLTSRPLSLSTTRTSGPTSFKRPTLREILSNSSPPPWTLTAFMAYLSTNHCLETLEFTMDAGRYKKHYSKVVAEAEEKGKPVSNKDWENIKLLWQRLIEAYIQTNGSREVNLPSEVREPLLSIDYNKSPPLPETLDTAVSKVYELMEDSVLVPFLNSFSPMIVQGQMDLNSRTSEEANTGDDKSRWRKSRLSKTSPPTSSHDATSPKMTSPSLSANRKSPTSSLSNAFSGKRFSTRATPTSSSSYGASGSVTVAHYNSESGHVPGLTDDSGNLSSSPNNDSPMTPPMSPPESELSTSPRQHRDSGAWRKLGRLGQWKPIMKRKSQQNFKDNYSMP